MADHLPYTCSAKTSVEDLRWEELLESLKRVLHELDTHKT